MLKRLALRFWRDQAGATAIEYGLIAGLIFIAVIVAVTLVGGQTSNLFNFVAERAGPALSGGH
ncbi:MAG TPA: Flp family type IVb pilin [Devosiaceae bacterium]|jgi:pilus assembly protein Flp/PilA